MHTEIETSITPDIPAPARLRTALTLTNNATDDDVSAALGELPTAAACDGCRHGYSDGRGHSSCNRYHPAWDVAEELGLADAGLERHGWIWTLLCSVSSYPA